MKIKIIGTGSMWAKFNSASYLIDDEILIDVPNGTCKNLFRMNLSPQKIRYVLITHFHGDHYFDMPFLFLLKAKATEKNLDIFCSEEGELKIQDLLKMAFPNSVEGVNKDIKLNYNFASTFKIGEYSITKYLVDHGKMKPVYGYIIETEEIKIGFTGDTTLCENVEYMASISDYLVCDCMFAEGTRKHMGIDHIKFLSKKYPKCKFLTTHMEDKTREELRQLKIDNIIIPNDGDEINI